jgi:hypothetical protein
LADVRFIFDRIPVSNTDRTPSEVIPFLQLVTVPGRSPPTSPKSSHLFQKTCPTLAVSVLIFVPHSSAVIPSRILQSSLSWCTFPTLLRPMAVTPLLSKLASLPSTTMCLLLFSPGTFKLRYAPWHTSKFLSQARATVTDGFMEGQLDADPTFGTCLQCAAIDRARLKTNPITPRSDICSNCFKRYCYDPQNPPLAGQLVGRRFKFADPDPFGIKSFYIALKTGIIVVAVFVVLGLIATLTGCVMFWWRRCQRKKVRAVAYRRLSGGDGSEWSAHTDRERNDMVPPRCSVPGHEEGSRIIRRRATRWRRPVMQRRAMRWRRRTRIDRVYGKVRLSVSCTMARLFTK